MDELLIILNNFVELDIDEILFDIYKRPNVSRFIIKLNQNNQILLGLNTDNDIIGLYRSIGYQLFKDSLPGRKAPFGVVDLNVTGLFFDTFKTEADKKGIEIIADTDLYGVDFNIKYGKIVGLIEENIQLWIEFLLPLIKESINKKLD